ncbi:MAG: SdpI family protein [Actinomycetota bacterium]
MDWISVLGLAAMLMMTGVLVGYIGWAASRGRLRRNWIAGIRTQASLTSDEAWDACHRAGGRKLMAAGLILIPSAIPLLFRPTNGLGLAIILASFVLTIALGSWATIEGNRAARDVLARTEPCGSGTP